jgi:hypothetical protein
MCTIDNFKIHRVSRLLVAVCISLTISASFAAAYVATAKSETGAQTEQTSLQVDRTKKGDPLRVPPQHKPVEREGAKQIEAPTYFAAPRMIA